MSNVSANEVFELTAEAFGVTLAEMGAHYRGRHRNALPRPLVARGVAVVLASRHTCALAPEMAKLCGRTTRTCGHRFTAHGRRVAEFMAEDAGIQQLVELVEQGIDELHEARADAMERARAAGLGGLIPRFKISGQVAFLIDRRGDVTPLKTTAPRRSALKLKTVVPYSSAIYDRVLELGIDGMAFSKIAAAIGVDTSLLSTWGKRHPEFRELLDELRRLRPTSSYHVSSPGRAAELIQAGMTETAIAAQLGVSAHTFIHWKKVHPELKAAVSGARAEKGGGASIRWKSAKTTDFAGVPVPRASAIHNPMHVSTG